MNINVKVKNSKDVNDIEFQTNGNSHTISIPSKPSGYGSDVNGGELLFLALAVCFCNDIYREAAKKDIKINNVEVEVNGKFDKEGEAASNITYSVKVEGDASEQQLTDLVKHTDTVTEIQNTLRQGVNVSLLSIKVV